MFVSAFFPVQRRGMSVTTPSSDWEQGTNWRTFLILVFSDFIQLSSICQLTQGGAILYSYNLDADCSILYPLLLYQNYGAHTECSREKRCSQISGWYNVQGPSQKGEWLTWEKFPVVPYTNTNVMGCRHGHGTARFLEVECLKFAVGAGGLVLKGSDTLWNDFPTSPSSYIPGCEYCVTIHFCLVNLWVNLLYHCLLYFGLVRLWPLYSEGSIILIWLFPARTGNRGIRNIFSDSDNISQTSTCQPSMKAHHFSSYTFSYTKAFVNVI